MSKETSKCQFPELIAKPVSQESWTNTKKTLLKVEGIVTPYASKSHIVYIFYLPQGSSRLNIDFSYEPKNLEDPDAAKEIISKELGNFILAEEQQEYLENWDLFLPLKNLLTLSFDDTSGYRGCAHRHDSVQHLIISEQDASPGLIAGLIPAGMFHITLSVHAVITNTCHYCLKVWEGDEAIEKVATL